MKESYIKDNRLKRIIQGIADNSGTTVEDVIDAMQEALIIGSNNPDPTVQEFWKQIPMKDKIPSPEEFIMWAAKMIQRQRNS